MREEAKNGVGQRERMKRGRGMNDRDERSRGIEIWSLFINKIIMNR